MRAENSRTQQYPQVNEGKIIDPARQMRQGENGNSALFSYELYHLFSRLSSPFLSFFVFSLNSAFSTVLEAEFCLNFHLYNARIS